MIKRRNAGGILVATVVLALTGCQETGSKQVSVRPPAATPQPSAALAKTVAPPNLVSQALPFSDAFFHLPSFPAPARPAIDVAVEQVRANFDRGQSDLKNGQPDKAQADFDEAVKALVASGFPTDSDPRLSQLVDQLGEYVHTDELDALTNAEAQEAQVPSQPAPIEEIADLTLPPGDPRLAAMAQKELFAVHHDLPLTVNDSVLQYLSFFTSARGRAIVEHGLERAGRYEPMIRHVLAEEGVPQDLIYLAQAESAFQPQAVSRAGARGIWQFMPYRGEEYDLERNYWIDERSDPEKATHAAAQHLRDLYGIFGDWYLVMAAYNSGPLNVARAIERTGYADFWDLQRLKALPQQTQNYVPIIIALALVAKQPALYGVHVDPEKPMQADTVKLDHSIDLRLVADASGADLDDLRLLNPQLLRSVTPAANDFELKLPPGKAESFEQNIQQVPGDKWTSWRLHSVEGGETLASIARQYRVTIASLETANHLDSTAGLPAGFLLTVPAVPAVAHLIHYRAERGDTLDGIADRFDVTVDDLKRWNHLRENTIPRGTRLRIYAGGNPASQAAVVSKPEGNSKVASAHTVAKSQTVVPKTASSVTHRVKPGETLYSIAKQYQTTVAAILQQNSFLTSRALRAGDLLALQR